VANEPLDLVSLIARLRSAGLRTDIRQYLAAHELLLAMAGQGRALQDDAEALASHLGPIFCGSPEEQHLFRHEVLAWRGEVRATAPASQPAIRKNKLRAWLVAGCVAAVIGIAGVVWWINRPDPGPLPEPPPPVVPAPKAIDQPPPPKSSFVVSKPTVVLSDDVSVESPREATVPWLTIAAGGLGAAFLTFLALWWRQKARRDFVLSRMTPDPNTKRIELNPSPPTLTKIRPLALRRISAGLRRTRANEVFDLSVTATVSATANAGGFVVPVFAPRVAIPEYLVLIDRRSESDHSAQLIYGWVTQLCDQGVAADCYEFDSDPRVCREFGTQRSHRLPALLARHHRATVFLCAESDVCMDAMTNKPQSWLRSFNSLPSRVFLSLAPPYRWAGQEQRLADAGFVVVPATPAGLHIAASMDRNSLEAIGTGAKYAREFPRLIAQDTLRWLDRNPPPEATVSRLLRALHDFLGPDGYSWLSACAVYPQISWPITLKLLDALLPSGTEIPARRAIDEQLPSIARLPWFRYGYMPDWLRKLLISHLDPEKEAKIRATLEQLVCGLLDVKETGDTGARDAASPKLSLRVRPKALEVARAAPASSPLQDEVFLDFLAGASPDPLSLRLSSAPFTGTPRTRSVGTRMRERWRALGVRRPVLMRSVISFLLAAPVTVILWAALRETPLPIDVPDSDITYYMASSDLSSSGTMVAVAPNGQFMLLASPRTGNIVEVWDLVRNEVRARIPILGNPHSMAISPRSDRIAIIDEGGDVYRSIAPGDFDAANLVPGYPFGDGRPDKLQVKMRFSNDSSRLLVYHREGMAVYEGQAIPAAWNGGINVDTAMFNPDDSNQIIAVAGGKVMTFDTRVASDRGTTVRQLFGDITEFSLDGRNSARVIIDPQSRAYQVEFMDTLLATTRGKVTSALPASDWVWSGDGNLVSYQEGRGGEALYDLSHGQLLSSGRSMQPATNRLRTIRFARSRQRRPNYTYYEVTERSVDVVPAAEPVQSPPPPDRSSSNTNTTKNPAEPQSPRTPPPVTDDTAAINKRVLAALDRDVRILAQRLVEMALKEGITIRLTNGRVTDGELVHGATQENSLDLHGIGRAFDFEVQLAKGRWSGEDLKRMYVVGQIGKKLGLTWGGDSNPDGFSHFELPPKADAPASSAKPPPQSNEPPQDVQQSTQSSQAPAQTAITPSENVPVAANRSLRFLKTDFDFPENPIYGVFSDSYTAIVQTLERTIAGSFVIRVDPISSKENESVRKVVFTGYGVENVDQITSLYPGRDENPNASRVSDAANVEITITAQEFANKVISKTIDSGLLQYTMTLKDPKLRRSAGNLAFDRNKLRIHITVQPKAGKDERRRAPSKSK